MTMTRPCHDRAFPQSRHPTTSKVVVRYSLRVRRIFMTGDLPETWSESSGPLGGRLARPPIAVNYALPEPSLLDPAGHEPGDFSGT